MKDKLDNNVEVLIIRKDFDQWLFKILPAKAMLSIVKEKTKDKFFSIWILFIEIILCT